MRRTAIALVLLFPLACSEPPAKEPAAEAIHVPQAQLVSPEARQRGKNLFMKYCAICHGVNGDGHGARSVDLTAAPRNFHDPVWAARTPPTKLFRTITDGISASSMPSFRPLDESERWDLVAYLMSLREGNGK